jgi:hypothetical protein
MGESDGMKIKSLDVDISPSAMHGTPILVFSDSF